MLEPVSPPEVSPRAARAPSCDGVIGSRRCLGCGEELAPHRQGACCSGRCRASLSRRRREEAQLRRDEEVRAGLGVVRAVVDDVLVLRAVVDDLMARLEGRNGKGRRA